MNNSTELKGLKSTISRDNNQKFCSKEEIIKLIGAESGVNVIAVEGVIRALQTLTVSRFANNQDMLIPGIMRIVPGAGGLTRRYIKIQSISETLKGKLK